MQKFLERVTFDKNDAASIRNGLHAARQVFEVAVWPYRDHVPSVMACRELWNSVLDAVLAYRSRAGLTQQECDGLSQWQPMPGQNYADE